MAAGRGEVARGDAYADRAAHRGGSARRDGAATQKRAGRPAAARRAAVMGAVALGGALALTAAAAGPVTAAPGHGGPGGGAHAPHYVALGDSYTSGPAIPTQIDPNCERSDHNYPSLVAAALRPASFTDVSCGGATTDAMWHTQRGNAPQLDAVTRDTTLVTLQIGGNDIGFGSIIATCASLTAGDPLGSPCKQHYDPAGTDQLTMNVLRTAPEVGAVLRGIHARAPHARVVVVGYPDLLPDDGTPCTSPVVPFAAGDFGYLRDTEKKLNAMLRFEAFLHGASYADTYTPTVGHDMCTAPGQRWIEPLVPASPAGPAHPNAGGEQAMSVAVLDRLEQHAGGHHG